MSATLQQPVAARARTQSIQLNWEQKDGELVVIPSDQDRFMIKVGKAIQLLRQSEREEEFSQQFDLLLKELATWLQDHDGRWQSAFLTAGDSSLRFIVVRKQVKFEGDITDSLSDLGVAIVNDPDLDLIKLSTRALPQVSEEALQSFLDPSFTLEYNGDRIRTHRSGKQKP